MISQETYDFFRSATASLVEAAETMIDGAGDETPDEMGLMGREVWAKDFDLLKHEAIKVAALLANINSTKGGK